MIFNNAEASIIADVTFSCWYFVWIILNFSRSNSIAADDRTTLPPPSSSTSAILLTEQLEVTQKSLQPIGYADSTYHPIPSKSQLGRIKLHLLEKVDKVKRPANNFTIFNTNFEPSIDKSSKPVFYFTLLAAFTIVVLLVVFLVLVPMLFFFGFRKLRRNRVMKLCKTEDEFGGLNSGTTKDGFGKAEVEMGNSFVATHNGSGTLVYAVKTPHSPKFRIKSNNNSLDSFLKSLFTFRKEPPHHEAPKKDVLGSQRDNLSATPDLNSNRTFSDLPDRVTFGCGVLSGLNGVKSEGPLRVYRWNDFWMEMILEAAELIHTWDIFLFSRIVNWQWFNISWHFDNVLSALVSRVSSKIYSLL